MQLLSVLLASEEEIKTRSKAVESHWSPDKYQDKSSGEKSSTDCHCCNAAILTPYACHKTSTTCTTFEEQVL